MVGRSRETAPASSRGGLLYCGRGGFPVLTAALGIWVLTHCSARIQWFWPGTRLSLLTAAVGFWVLTAALRVFWPAAHLRVSRLENAIVDAFLVVGRSRETAPASSRGGLLYCGGVLDLDLGQRRHPYSGCRLYLSFTFRCCFFWPALGFGC